MTVCDGKPPHHARSLCNSMQSHHSFWDLSILEHYIDESFVGSAMALEMAEAYYKTKTFCFDYHELFLVHKLLRVDRFGYGFRPVELIRNVEIVLYADYNCSCNRGALFRHGHVSEDATAEDAICFCLEQLFSLKVRLAKIKLVIFLNRAKRLRLNGRFVELLQIIHPFVQRFKSPGFQLSFGLHDSYGNEWSMDDSADTSVEQALSNMIAAGSPFYLDEETSQS